PARASLATSSLVRTVVPKSIDGERSTSAQAVSTGSSSGTRTIVSASRAESGQSTQRTSSPGSYDRVMAGSPPGPGRRPRRSPWSRPSSRRATRSSTRRRRASAPAGAPPRSGWTRSGNGPSAAQLDLRLGDRVQDRLQHLVGLHVGRERLVAQDYAVAERVVEERADGL